VVVRRWATPILFISKKLSGAECNYAVVEKECFAIVWVVKTLRNFLEGKELRPFSPTSQTNFKKISEITK
jgi:hypothetical protein